MTVVLTLIAVALIANCVVTYNLAKENEARKIRELERNVQELLQQTNQASFLGGTIFGAVAGIFTGALLKDRFGGKTTETNSEESKESDVNYYTVAKEDVKNFLKKIEKHDNK